MSQEKCFNKGYVSPQVKQGETWNTEVSPTRMFTVGCKVCGHREFRSGMYYVPERWGIDAHWLCEEHVKQRYPFNETPIDWNTDSDLGTENDWRSEVDDLDSYDPQDPYDIGYDY